MQTGWRHDDHQSQREFERLRKTAATDQTVAAEQPAATDTPNVSIQPEQKEYGLESPLGTISVNTQRQGFKTIWKIERPLTISINDVPIASRVDAYKPEYTYNTVNHLRFKAGNNIHLAGRYVEQDKVELTVSAKFPSGSLEGSLSTVWIRDLTNNTKAYVGYNPIDGFNTALFIGPWGFQNAQNSTVALAGSGYSNIAKDTQWSMANSIQSSAVGPWTYTGKVDKAGLYWVYGTTQGHRWLFNSLWNYYACVRVHYFLVIKRNNYPEQGQTYKIYKPLDIHPYDIFFPQGVESGTIVSNMSSAPWSVNGGAMVYLESGDEICHLLTFQNVNGGYTAMSFGVGYHAVEACLIADASTLDPATQVDLWPINDGELVQSYQLFQFANV